MRISDRCLRDVVVDTNILSHSDNAGSTYQESAIGVLSWIRSSSVTWMLDDQGQTAPDPSTSLLYAEYRRTLSQQGAAMILFAACLQNGRVRFAPRPTEAVRRQIRSLIPRNTGDRAVLGAACGTQDRTLVSNDLTDFSDAVRDSVEEKFGVWVCTSDEAVA